jgi:serine/threonine protein kinase
LEVVDGRYRLEKVIGEGAAGTVWLARDERREIDVALKILRPKLATTKEMLERFVREADLAERMLSPHIVRVLARGTTKDAAPYIAYELLEGEDLGTRLARGGRLSVEESRAAIVHTCRALARAHAIGVLHRDIKPDNLFVTKVEGRPLVKVLDFGVAELVRSVDRDGPLVGTLEYLAPEVVLGERAPSARSDLFSVGVVAYRCLAGAPPFKADNMGQLVLAHAKHTPRPLREIDTRIPVELERWMERAIARDPDARFESAREMAETLDRAVSTLNIKTTGLLPNLDAKALRRREPTTYSVVLPREEPDEPAPPKKPRRQ